MIRTFRHKGLRRLFEEKDARGVPPQMAAKIRRMLAQLNVSETPDDMGGMPGWRLHPLKGGRAGEWSVTVTGNLRIVFRFDGKDAVEVDLVDYH
ncbi:MAG TPA: type II toxin-antitoxin system RelE/ParE family toxin [Rhizomicrobium sp.]|jgi:proteic killer suppression protein|nr:type II toxin-antitoxin system RelE/ParE family toxin [Rhizomicrobium sp.]